MELYLDQEALLWHCVRFTRWAYCSCKEIQTRWACFSKVFCGWQRAAQSNSPDGGLQYQVTNVPLGLLHPKPCLSQQKLLYGALEVPKSSGDHIVLWYIFLTCCSVSTCWERQSWRRFSTKLLRGETGSYFFSVPVLWSCCLYLLKLNIFTPACSLLN